MRNCVKILKGIRKVFDTEVTFKELSLVCAILEFDIHLTMIGAKTKDYVLIRFISFADKP